MISRNVIKDPDHIVALVSSGHKLYGACERFPINKGVRCECSCHWVPCQKEFEMIW